ncbi:MAG: insulinase family protein [Chloroflexi bacterium]|nr:insulinase family protein [Chloroflexota bacterium]
MKGSPTTVTSQVVPRAFSSSPQVLHLANGATVVLREDSAAPLVAFYVFYRVGSRNESTGRTGLSHWVEHLLFDGTKRYPKGALHRLVVANGGYRNGFTWNDGTAFFEVLPSDRIDLALDLEADRMANALFDPEEVERERTVIISERQGGENYPGNALYEEVLATAYKVHPYGQPIIGWKTDLERITRADLWNHYRRFYHPNNAIIVAVGDFSAASLLERIDKFFGSLEAGEQAADVGSVEPPQEGERRVTVQRPGGTPMLLLAYHIPAASHPDLPPLAVLDAVLSGGKGLGHAAVSLGRSSRLRRVLVDTGMASSVYTSVGLQADPGLFFAGVTVKPGMDAQAVEARLIAEIERLAAEPVSEQELSSAREQCIAQLVFSTEGVSRQASSLGRSLITGMASDIDELTRLFDRVSSEDVQHVAQHYLRQYNRTSGTYLPAESSKKVMVPPTPTAVLSSPTKQISAVSVAHRRSLEVDRDVIDQGITVLTHHAEGAPWQLFQVSVPGGSADDSEGLLSVAAVEGALRLRGSVKFEYNQLSAILDRHAIQLVGGAGDYFSSYWMKALLSTVPLGLELLAQVILAPSYPESYLQAVKVPFIAAAIQEQSNTRAVAERLFRELAYPEDHPMHRWPVGTPNGIESITRDDVLRHAERFRHQGGIVIAASGGLTRAQVLTFLSDAFKGSPFTEIPRTVLIPPVTTVPSVRRASRSIPEKTQTDLVIGLPGVRRTDPDYYALSVADAIFGRLGMGGRLGEEIRERRGLAYYASSALEAGFGPGPWAARIGVAPQHVAQAIEATLSEWERFAVEGPTEEELKDAKQWLTGSLPLRFETSEGIATQLVAVERFGMSLHFIEDYISAIESVTNADVIQVTRRYYHADRVVTAIAGPEQ